MTGFQLLLPGVVYNVVRGRSYALPLRRERHSQIQISSDCNKEMDKMLENGIQMRGGELCTIFSLRRRPREDRLT